MRKFNMFIVIFFTISFLFACGGGGSSGGSSDDSCVGDNCRIKKVHAIITGSAMKSTAITRSSYIGVMRNDVDISSEDFTAEFDTEGRVTKVTGNATLIDANGNPVIANTCEITYATDYKEKIWRDVSNTIVWRTEIYYNKHTTSEQSNTYIKEYSVDSGTSTHQFTYRLNSNPGIIEAWRVTTIDKTKQDISVDTPPESISMTPSLIVYRKTVNYYPGTDNINQKNDYSDTTETTAVWKKSQYYTVPEEVDGEIIVTEIIKEKDKPGYVTKEHKTNVKKEVIEDTLDEDPTIVENTVTGTPITEEGTLDEETIIVPDQTTDFTYEKEELPAEAKVNTNWFNEFRSELMPFID